MYILDDSKNGKQEILTKGDNNPFEDRGLYNEDYGPMTKMWLTEDEVLGRAFGFLPNVGMLTIYLQEYPAFKFGLIGILGLFVLVAKE